MKKIGPAAQSYGYGFGVGNYGGTVTGVAQNRIRWIVEPRHCWYRWIGDRGYSRLDYWF